MAKTLDQLGIPQSFVRCDPSIKLNRDSIVTAVCACGAESSLKVSSILRTIKRVGFYRCLSCAMVDKHKDPEYKQKHIDGVSKSWTSEKRKHQSGLSKSMWMDDRYRKKVSDSSSEAWQSPDIRKKASEDASNRWKSEGYKRNHADAMFIPGVSQAISCTVSRMWKNPEYIAKQMAVKSSEKHIELQRRLAFERFSNPEYKKHISDSLKALWKDNPEMRKEMSNRVKALWKDPEYAEKQACAVSNQLLILDRSNRTKKQWENKDARKAIIDGIKKAWEDPEYRDKIRKMWEDPDRRAEASEKSKLKWKDSNYREKQAKAQVVIRKMWEDPDRRAEASEKSKLKWKDSNYREKQAKARASILSGGKDSILERTAQTLLGSLGIPYIRHHVVGYFEFDLFIPSEGVLIECNGEYWHSLCKPKDAAKFSYIDTYFPEYKILYLWERDFLNPNLIRHKLIRAVFGDREKNKCQADFKFEDLKIEKSDMAAVDGSYYSKSEEFLQSFHYAGFGRNSKIVYELKLGEELIGVCKFCHPIREEAATSMGFEPKQVLELDRLCLHPNFWKKNLASWFISRVSKMAFLSNPSVSVLISFADYTMGHVGTVYKASNWTKVHEVPPDYHYVSPEGFVVHKRTLYSHAVKNKCKESEYADKFGYVKAWGKSKTKFKFDRPKKLTVPA